jgi:ribonuclease III
MSMNAMQIESRLGIVFRDRRLLELALVHGSQVNENRGALTASNERLEFLGDAVLGMVVAEELYHNLPNVEEGALTAARSALVRREALAETARTMGLGAHLRLGRGEAATGGRHKEKNLADALEAVIAAVYLDQGYPAARAFILRILQPKLQDARSRGVTPNYKAMLQERLQSMQQPVPRYRVVSAVGPDHQKEFTVEALVDDTILGRGTGPTRKAAETAAARDALTQSQTKEE